LKFLHHITKELCYTQRKNISQSLTPLPGTYPADLQEKTEAAEAQRFLSGRYNAVRKLEDFSLRSK
jgi:hypothetical protein